MDLFRPGVPLPTKGGKNSIFSPQEYQQRSTIYTLAPSKPTGCFMSDKQNCRSTTRLRQDVLVGLIARIEPYGIEDTRIRAAEKVIIFLDYCAHKKTYRELRRVYRHSLQTFTRIINDVAKALVSLFKDATKDLPLLEPHTRIRAAEKIIIFLDYCAHKKTYRELRRVYQHSFRTFTRIINTVAKALVRLYLDATKDMPSLEPHIQLMDSTNSYFRGCVGALDGSYIPVRLTGVDPSPFRSRKGLVSQNVMFACDFDLNIIFVQPGYEGSANDDGTVLRKAL